ncbi:hypothetical protein DRN73_01710 [Candidatus Pacearchaeota archaeon]|nr:MAG: hypothetical protein DRN73_01710 [Candidatus Pacearchaeota archaeon]
MDFYIITIYFLTYLGLFVFAFYSLSLLDYSKKKESLRESDDKTVTVIIPAYNESKSIEKTIESALASDYPKEKMEIIVVDDGSKDNTYELARKFTKSKKFRVRVYTKKNGGKGSALNFGIKKSHNEIIFTMDADSFIQPRTIKKMVAYFSNEKVMSVTPSMGVYNPKGILQRIQQIEYYLGVFLRKSFATLNAIHVTPGAFSAYRRKFFEKYGGYDEKNITEDLEIALRIQSHNLIIENAPEAVVYTIAPRKFKDLLIQRKRWYAGLMKNLWHYRNLFGAKTGALGLIVLPLAVITVPISIFLTMKIAIKALWDLKKELIMFNSINFKFFSFFEANSYFFKNFFEKIFYKVLTDPILIIGILFILLLIVYLHFAKKKMLYKEKVKLSLVFFILFYSLLFSFWWIMSAIYVFFNKKIAWRDKK